MTDLRTAAQMALDALNTTETAPGSEQFLLEERTIEALSTALSEPDPEPVAYRYDFPNPDDPTEIIRDWVAQSLDEVKRCGGVNIRPLYTAPQREWQGLTMKELDDLVDSQPHGFSVYQVGHVFALDVEAKLKEKNS